MRRLRDLGWKKLLGLGVGSLALALVAFVGIGYAVTSVPKPSELATRQATRVLYAGTGGEIGRIGKNRVLKPLSEVSTDAQHAILAAEDRQFYSEPGISFKGIGRAIYKNLSSGGVSEGGSTITQQYAKNAFLTQQRTFSRKIKEVFIALKLAKTKSKATILEDYLNVIYFGRGAYGIEAASETYFHQPAKDLNVAEAAVLAASIRSPAGYDPAKHPERAKQRWVYVLDGMVKQGWLSAADRAAVAYPKVQAPSSGQGNDFPGYRSYLKAQVIADLERHGFPEARLTAGGLTVRTTLQRGAEQAAAQAVEDKIPAATAGNPPVGALVAVQPGTGAVVAYYGGRTAGGTDFADSPGKGVQPGSSMKPYVLAAALEKGISLDTRYDGSSPQDVCGTVINNDAGDGPLGRIDLAEGLQKSVNTVYVRLACDVGPKRVVDIAHAAGIPDRDQLDGDGTPSAQIALGSGGYELHVIDQATGYATFAAQGQRAKPYFVTTVSDASGEVYRAKPDTGSAFSKGVAADATYAMQQVVAGGTGVRAQLAGGRPTAGKTGTTGQNANAWFAGFTPQLATAVWVGRQQGGPLRGVLGSDAGIYGGTVPAEIFKTFMDAALQGQPNEDFPPRAGVGGRATPSFSPPPAVSATPSVTATPTVVPTATPTISPRPVQPSATALPVQPPVTQPPTSVPTQVPPLPQPPNPTP